MLHWHGTITTYQPLVAVIVCERPVDSASKNIGMQT
jgi:hypothetical protein